jgi:hypothetical protein
MISGLWSKPSEAAVRGKITQDISYVKVTELEN